MGFDNATIVFPGLKTLKPHIVFIDGFWRVSFYFWWATRGNVGKERWTQAHSVVSRWNAHRTAAERMSGRARIVPAQEESPCSQQS